MSQSIKCMFDFLLKINTRSNINLITKSKMNIQIKVMMY